MLGASDTNRPSDTLLRAPVGSVSVRIAVLACLPIFKGYPVSLALECYASRWPHPLRGRAIRRYISRALLYCPQYLVSLLGIHDMCWSEHVVVSVLVVLFSDESFVAAVPPLVLRQGASAEEECRSYVHIHHCLSGRVYRSL